MKNSRLFLLILGVVLTLSACSDSANYQNLSVREKAGKLVFAQNCAACHATTGDLVIVGPSLSGIGERAGSKVAGEDARTYIENSILDPAIFINEGFEDLMPRTFNKIIKSESLDDLIAYLMILE